MSMRIYFNDEIEDVKKILKEEMEFLLQTK